MTVASPIGEGMECGRFLACQSVEDPASPCVVDGPAMTMAEQRCGGAGADPGILASAPRASRARRP
jgi:hypothetical protein